MLIELFLANVNSCSLYVVVRPSVCLSSITFVHPTQAIEIFGKFLRHSIPWPSATLRYKFYGDRPRGTPPLEVKPKRGRKM